MNNNNNRTYAKSCVSIPALRFPEFKGEWERKKIEESIDFLTGYPFNGEDISEDSHGIPLLRGINISEGTIRHNTEIDRYYLGDKTKLKKYLLKKGDLVIGMDGSKVGKNSAIINTPNANSILVQRVARLREKQNTSILFIYEHINSIHFHKYVDAVKTSSGIPHISPSQIKDFTISFPSLPEQTKIAFFLTKVDDKLIQLKKKKTLLDQYKKGVMQKIFSQEIRFKDENGKKFPEWEENEFGFFYTFKTTNSFSRDKLNYKSGVVKNIHYGDIHTKFKTLFDISKEDTPYIDNRTSVDKIPIENYCREGDLVIADASEDYKDIGKSIEITKLNNEKVVAGLHTLLARPNLNKVSFGFGAYLMKADYIHFQIRRISQGTKVLGLSSKKLSGISVNLPCLAEQTKIANSLSAIDEKINLCAIQLEKMEQWKKGLLQKMFV